jgi:L-alanine-DL-glutamate epimerase-like enolase superfamily enzyme
MNARVDVEQAGRSLLVTLRWLTAGDRVGVGEASPLPGYSPDDLVSCRAALAALGGRVQIEDRPPFVTPVVGAPAARFALETAALALLDGPAHVLLGGPREPRPIAMSSLVDSVDAARAAVARGVTTLKVKVREDLWLAAAVRALGAAAVRIDANRSWSDARATSLLAEAAALGLELVEEPIADPARLPAPPLPVAVALDESLQHLDARAVAALARAGRVQVLVLKPTALGGAVRCLEWARVATDLGLRVYVTHTNDGPIARRAALALARALPEPPLACGLEGAESC